MRLMRVNSWVFTYLICESVLLLNLPGTNVRMDTGQIAGIDHRAVCSWLNAFLFVRSKRNFIEFLVPSYF